MFRLSDELIESLDNCYEFAGSYESCYLLLPMDSLHFSIEQSATQAITKARTVGIVVTCAHTRDMIKPSDLSAARVSMAIGDTRKELNVIRSWLERGRHTRKQNNTRTK